MVIQNLANDRYLRLLDTPWGLKQLRQLVNSKSASKTTAASKSARKFRVITPSEEMLGWQSDFELRKAS